MMFKTLGGLNEVDCIKFFIGPWKWCRGGSENQAWEGVWRPGKGDGGGSGQDSSYYILPPSFRL